MAYASPTRARTLAKGPLTSSGVVRFLVLNVQGIGMERDELVVRGVGLTGAVVTPRRGRTSSGESVA